MCTYEWLAGMVPSGLRFAVGASAGDCGPSQPWYYMYSLAWLLGQCLRFTLVVCAVHAGDFLGDFSFQIATEMPELETIDPRARNGGRGGRGGRWADFVQFGIL